MDNAVLVSRWLAAVRVITGAVFVYMGTGHLLAGWATADGFARAIGGFGKTDPLQAYTGVMAPVVLGAPAVFGPLFVFGMLAAGIGIMFGVFTPVALVGGVWLNVLMLAVEIGFLWTGAWRAYSLDELLVGFRARSRPPSASLLERNSASTAEIRGHFG